VVAVGSQESATRTEVTQPSADGRPPRERDTTKGHVAGTQLVVKLKRYPGDPMERGRRYKRCQRIMDPIQTGHIMDLQHVMRAVDRRSTYSIEYSSKRRREREQHRPRFRLFVARRRDWQWADAFGIQTRDVNARGTERHARAPALPRAFLRKHDTRGDRREERNRVLCGFRAARCARERPGTHIDIEFWGLHPGLQRRRNVDLSRQPTLSRGQLVISARPPPDSGLQRAQVGVIRAARASASRAADRHAVANLFMTPLTTDDGFACFALTIEVYCIWQRSLTTGALGAESKSSASAS
jgi:hypothetical protein